MNKKEFKTKVFGISEGKGINFIKGKPVQPLTGEIITGVQRMGGYYHWNWKFPFRHFVKEELLVFYKDKILKIA